MDFVEFVREKSRMCSSFGECSNGCPLRGLDCDSIPESDGIDKASLMQEEVEKWVEEHPFKTNRDKFREVFGLELDNGICAEIKHNCTGTCYTCDFEGFWDRPYEGKE